MKINGKLIALFATVLLLLSIAMPTLAIDRHSGQDRYDTAVEISKGGWENGAEVVVLARGDIYADALVGVSLAYANNAPILLTKTDNLPQVTRDEIARLSPSKIYILGGTGAISQEIQDELQGMEIEVERISGDNRFDTAAKVAEMLVQNGADTAFLVYGLNFPDGVSAAAYAAQLGAPILFTHTDVLPEETMAALEALDPEHIFVIGGPAVISDDILDGLENVTRLYGANRYETSVALAERFAGNANKMYIAAGNDTSGGIDGITGAALAARMGTGLLLVGGTLSDEVEDFLASSVEEVFILGGASAVSPGLAEEIERAKDVRPDEPALDVLFYTGKNFCKSTSPIVSGEEIIQTIGKDGSITITIQDEAYIDSGFVIEVGTLGNLGSIEVEGSGDYGLNLYFDLDGDGQFFTWNGNEHIGLGG
jgi:lactocepin